MHCSGADCFVTSCVLRCSVKSHSKTSLMMWHKVKLQYLLFPWQPWWSVLSALSWSVLGGWKRRRTKGSFSPLHAATSGELELCAEKPLDWRWTEHCLLTWSCFSFTQLLSLMVLMMSKLICFPRFYSSPYSISTNRMIAQTSITPFIAASPVSTYQVRGSLLG